MKGGQVSHKHVMSEFPLIHLLLLQQANVCPNDRKEIICGFLDYFNHCLCFCPQKLQATPWGSSSEDGMRVVILLARQTHDSLQNVKTSLALLSLSQLLLNPAPDADLSDTMTPHQKMHFNFTSPVWAHHSWSALCCDPVKCLMHSCKRWGNKNLHKDALHSAFCHCVRKSLLVRVYNHEW